MTAVKMTTAELLGAALARLGDNGEHWTTGALARTADGEPCSPHAAAAVAWCATAAVDRAAGDNELLAVMPHQKAHEALMAALPLGIFSVGRYNDDADGFGKVRSLFTSAIAGTEAS